MCNFSKSPQDTKLSSLCPCVCFDPSHRHMLAEKLRATNTTCWESSESSGARCVSPTRRQSGGTQRLSCPHYIKEEFGFLWRCWRNFMNLTGLLTALIIVYVPLNLKFSLTKNRCQTESPPCIEPQRVTYISH